MILQGLEKIFSMALAPLSQSMTGATFYNLVGI